MNEFLKSLATGALVVVAALGLYRLRDWIENETDVDIFKWLAFAAIFVVASALIGDAIRGAVINL